MFISIAPPGVVRSAPGRMCGDIGPWWTIRVGATLIWAPLDTPGVQAGSISGGRITRPRARVVGGAFFLGLAHGVLSGSRTVGFIAPILAMIAIQEKIVEG
ncbi:MAG: hypothetical protein GY859_14370 [Desulfobacterales bacterium]|nr:hypothetical protein [Desulfobacterales bacterium]